MPTTSYEDQTNSGCSDHPGGQQSILKYAVSLTGIEKRLSPFFTATNADTAKGKDATAAYDPIHPAGTLDKYLDQKKHLGPVIQSNTTETSIPLQKGRPSAEEQPPAKVDRVQLMKKEVQHPPQPANKPPLSHCLNLFDFESVARQVLNPTSWAYFSSAADDEIVWPHYLQTPSITDQLTQDFCKDLAREPPSLPPRMVPASRPRQRQAGRCFHNTARHQIIAPLLHYRYSLEQACSPRR